VTRSGTPSTDPSRGVAEAHRVYGAQGVTLPAYCAAHRHSIGRVELHSRIEADHCLRRHVKREVRLSHESLVNMITEWKAKRMPKRVSSAARSALVCFSGAMRSILAKGPSLRQNIPYKSFRRTCERRRTPSKPDGAGMHRGTDVLRLYLVDWLRAVMMFSSL
jgi:hypothetical protein